MGGKVGRGGVAVSVSGVERLRCNLKNYSRVRIPLSPLSSSRRIFDFSKDFFFLSQFSYSPSNRMEERFFKNFCLRVLKFSLVRNGINREELER